MTCGVKCNVSLSNLLFPLIVQDPNISLKVLLVIVSGDFFFFANSTVLSETWSTPQFPLH